MSAWMHPPPVPAPGRRQDGHGTAATNAASSGRDEKRCCQEENGQISSVFVKFREEENLLSTGSLGSHGSVPVSELVAGAALCGWRGHRSHVSRGASDESRRFGSSSRVVLPLHVVSSDAASGHALVLDGSASDAVVLSGVERFVKEHVVFVRESDMLSHVHKQVVLEDRNLPWIKSCELTSNRFNLLET